MTEIQKIIELLLPELIALINGENSSELLQKELDNQENPSIHWSKKGVCND